MRVTISRATTGEPLFSLVDGSWLNAWPVRGEVFGLERDGLEGWFESVDPRVEDQPDLPGLPGSFWPEETLLASRILVVRGFHMRSGGGSSLTVSRVRDLVASLVGVPLRVRVEDAAGPREVTGFISSRIPLTRVSERGSKFSLIITCPDPLKYGDPVHYEAVSGPVMVENVGTGDVAPVLTVSGAVTLLRAECGGQVVEWQGAASGLVLDLADGIPRNSAGVEVGVLVWADPLRIPPGRHELVVTSDGSVTVTVRPGWQ